MRSQLPGFFAVTLSALIGGGCNSSDAGPDAGVSVDQSCDCVPDMAGHALDNGIACTAMTGAACVTDGNCCPSMGPASTTPVCTRSSLFGGETISWEAGYCQAPCRPAKNDSQGINRTDCPGKSPVCDGNRPWGSCWAGCQSVLDCRDEYVCGWVTGTPTAACVPQAASQCDPPGAPRPSQKSCPNGQRCVSFSPDDSLGRCAFTCDPVLQDCPPPMSVSYQCQVDLASLDGSGVCMDWNELPGADPGIVCQMQFQCFPGDFCLGQRCRRLCRVGGVDGGPKGGLCPKGMTCQDIVIPGQVINFHSDRTGVCLP